MQFQKQINISPNNEQYQYRTKEFYLPNRRIIYQGPKIYKEEIYYQCEPDSNKINSGNESEKQLEINNEENPNSKIYAIRREINSANGKIPSSQLIKDGIFNSSLKNIRKNLKAEIEPSPKTINIGDTKEIIEYNYRTINTRRSPNITRRIISRKDDIVEYRDSSFDGNRNYYNNRRLSNNYYYEPQNYIIRNQRMDNSPINYIERSGNRIIDKMNNDYYYIKRNSSYGEQMSPYNNNYDELNISNDYGGSSYDNNINNNNKRQTFGDTISNDYDYRQNRFDNGNQYTYQGNNMQRIRNSYDYKNYNNNINTNEYQSQTSKIRNINSKNNMLTGTKISFAPKNHQRYSSINMTNNEFQARDNIQEKYQNQTYNNMTYNDVKNIVNKFTRVYDPKKNENGLLIEENKVIVPGAEDEVFYNRHRVLNKMRRLSNILLAKQNSNNIKGRSSSKKEDDEIFYTLNTNFNNRTTNNFYREENNEYFDENNNYSNINNISDNEYNIRSINRYQSNKKAKTPIKYITRKNKGKNKNKRFKYVSLAMLASKGVNTENRIILRKMRLEKGGVVDLAQIEKRKGKYKIRKVSRSPGYNKTYYRKTFIYREKAAKKIQEWWRKMKSFMSKKILKIIKIQSVYRGRFVRKYLYDLLYLNYLYLSFCQKIEQVLKKKIKPYIFYILKNYGKSKSISLEEIKDFDILRNIIASKEKKWKILNMRKGMNKLKQYLRHQQKITLALYKLLKLKAEMNNNKNSLMKNALRKWNYITKIDLIKLNNNNDNKNNITLVVKNQNDKIKGLFNIFKGVNLYAKKSALEPTIPKIINYLKKEKLNCLLRKLINNKAISDKEKLKNYFYKYIRITLKYLTEKEKEEIKKEITEEVQIKIAKEEKIKKEEEPIKEDESQKEIKKLKGKTNKVIKPKYIITKEELINIPKTYSEKKEEPKGKKPILKIDKSMKKMEIKGIPKEKERIIEIVKSPEKKEIKEQKLEIYNYENIELKGKEKRKDEIMKMKGRVFLYLINSARNKQDKNILRKYFNKYLKKILQIQRDEDRKIFKEKQDQIEYDMKKENQNALKRIKLMHLPRIKENINKNILKKYFDIWKKNAINNKESNLKLFIKILDIIVDNYNRKLIHKKLNQWKKNIISKKIEKSIETDPITPPEMKIQTIVQQDIGQEFDIFDTLKNIKDIINFNDYLRNIYVNKYGKEFLDKLDKTRNPKMINKIMKKIFRKKNLINRNNLRKALNQWKNNIDIEKVLKFLKTKLLFTLYKNKINIQSNLLQKYFDRWKNINTVEKIKNEIYNLQNTQKTTKTLLLKTYIRNKDNNDKNELLKTYINKWKSILKSDVPKLNNLFKKIISLNNKKNGPIFIDDLTKNKNINKRNNLLLKYIPKRNQLEKMILYKNLMNWRNKLNDKKRKDIYNNYKKHILTILFNKNDKLDISKAFNKWRYNKKEKIPINAYLIGFKKIKNLLCKQPFNQFVNKMDKTNPEKLKSKGTNIVKALDKIIKEKPYIKFINNMKMLIRTNKLKNVLPKVHEKIKDYYLKKYINIWKNNTKEQRIKNMKIITKWLKKKYDIEKDKKLKRRNELLKRIINNKIKLNKYQLIFPLRFWKKIASILTYNINARIIQKFWRRMQLKKKWNKKHNQNKLKNILLNLYKTHIIKTISEPEQYQDIKEYLITKEENKDKLRNIFNNRDDYNNKLLLRLALEKWNEGKPEFDNKLQKIQNKIRQFISKRKLNNIILLQNILKNILKSNEAKDKKLLNDKFIQWFLIAKKLNYHDTSKIEEFIRKIAIGRLVKKLQGTLNRYSNKYFIYLLNNIAKINKLKNALKKKPNQITFDEIIEYIRKNDIMDILEDIINNQNDKYNILLKKKYLDKWKDKVDEIYNKENQSAITIQKILKGRKIQKEINRELNIKKILKQIINRYDNNNKLNLAFKRWGRITKKISCNENARIIQNFCRKIHDKYLKLKKEKNVPIYKTLSNSLIHLGKNPKRDFFDKLYIIYKNKKLEETLDNIDNKRKEILKDVLDNIKYNNKLILLKNIFDNTENKNKYIINKILNKWKNKAFNNKYIFIFLNKFLQKLDKKNNDILRSALYTWLYRAMFIKIKNKEKMISLFCKDITKKKRAISNWRNLVDKLRNQECVEDIYEIIDNLKRYKNINILFNIIEYNIKKDANDALKKNNNLLIFKQRLGDIFINLNAKENEINLKKYLDIWKNKANNIKNRLNKLEQLMDLLDSKIVRDDANTMYQVFFIKKLFNDMPKIYKYTALNKLKDFSDNKDKNQKLGENLLLAKKDIKPKIVSPLIKKIYKVYAYKILDNLFNTLNKGLKRNSENDKNIFMGKMISNFSDKYKDYIYTNKIEKEKKPYTKKILFKTKKLPKNEYIPNKSNLKLPLISPLVNLLDNLIKKTKDDALNKIINNYKAKTLIKIISDYVKEKEKPNYQEIIDILKSIKNKCENEGPQKAKLYKLLRKYIIKQTFLYKKDIYKMSKIFYLINLTRFNLEMAKGRWIRQILRKWRFISFVRKMTREKMELMYKNLHVSYLEMVNTIFSDEESKNPGVAKEFERFGNGIGMFINEDPYIDLDEKLCLGVKKKYLFQNGNLGMEKIDEITKKVEGEKIIMKEEYVNDLSEAKEGDIIIGEETGNKIVNDVKDSKDIKDVKDKEQSEDDNDDEEGEEEEDENDENNN